MNEEISELIDAAQVKVAELSINVALKDKEVDLIRAQYAADRKLAEMEAASVAVIEASKRARFEERTKTEVQHLNTSKKMIELEALAKK